MSMTDETNAACPTLVPRFSIPVKWGAPLGEPDVGKFAWTGCPGRARLWGMKRWSFVLVWACVGCTRHPDAPAPVAAPSSGLPTASLASADPGPRLPSDALAMPGPCAPERCFGAATNALAFDLYRPIRTSPGNLVFSPAGLELGLTLLYLGVSGATADTMRRALHYDLIPANAVDQALQSVNQRWRAAGGGLTLEVANRLFAERSVSLGQSYVDRTRVVLGADVGRVDFSGQAEASRLEINRWVASATHDKIRDLLPAGAVGTGTRLVLVDTVYFNGQWIQGFDPRATRKANFFVSGQRTTSVELMTQHGKFPYLESATDGTKVLSLGYQGNECDLLVVLPRERDGLAALEERLSLAELGTWSQALVESEVHVGLPRFRLAPPAQNLTGVLGTLGLNRLFAPNNPDLAPMFPAEPRPGLGSVLHQAMVEVSEVGTVAAAATGASMGITARGAKFWADHPFLFVLRDRRAGAILFMGRVADPSG
jgi:serpin B